MYSGIIILNPNYNVIVDFFLCFINTANKVSLAYAIKKTFIKQFQNALYFGCFLCFIVFLVCLLS